MILRVHEVIEFFSVASVLSSELAKRVVKYFFELRPMTQQSRQIFSILQFSCVYTQMNSKVGFWPRQLGSKFLVFTRALLFSNGRSLQTQKLAPPPCQNSNF